MKKLILGAVTAAFMGAAPITPARAEVTELEVLFIKTDHNGDLVLDLGEVLIVTIGQFKDADSDRDGKLEKEEAGDLAKDAEFSDNDTNKDSALSLEEVIAEKIEDFKAADSDKDRVLTFEELKTVYDANQ